MWREYTERSVRRVNPAYVLAETGALRRVHCAASEANWSTTSRTSLVCDAGFLLNMREQGPLDAIENGVHSILSIVHRHLSPHKTSGAVHGRIGTPPSLHSIGRRRRGRETLDPAGHPDLHVWPCAQSRWPQLATDCAGSPAAFVLRAPELHGTARARHRDARTRYRSLRRITREGVALPRRRNGRACSPTYAAARPWTATSPRREAIIQSKRWHVP